MRAFLLSSVVVFGLVDAAAADDMSGRFAGPSVGLILNATESRPEMDNVPDVLDDSQIFGGVYVGYDWQNENSVVGAIVDFDYVDMASSGKAELTNYTYDVDWVATARMRAGYTFTPDSLLYLTGGVAAGRFAASEQFLASDSVSEVKMGAVAGVGFEYAWQNGLLAKSELLYYDFKGLDLANTSISPSFYTMKLGLGYRF
ncbi:MAG: hypothetical protein CML29_18225 [Rhizobiales bacterium]|nr:hypothetical protein [Hyphomicrobiales bacterium]MBA69878.1 hypothetical protein [Hyphomicrobiales bacterium]|tara:strand:+ start:274 stop:876 length:603 start_codon:yes stop_codon:yes gene_type:complete